MNVRKQMRKGLALACSLALALSMGVFAPTQARAETGQPGQAVTFSTSGGHVGVIDQNNDLWMWGNMPVGDGTQPGSTERTGFKEVKETPDIRVKLTGAQQPQEPQKPEKRQFMDSGSASLSKLTKQEMAEVLAAAATQTPAELFVTTPSCAAPYSAGEMRKEVLDAAADRLSALRRIAGLPAVTADPALSEQAQYGAVLLAASDFSHSPKQPGDMDSGFYSKAVSATGSSNIFAGMPFMGTMDGFMDDSDAGNIARVGHRRWQLNPGMGKVGFGYAVANSGYRYYTAEKVFDSSGRTTDYDFISWPASGNFPSDLSAFQKDTAWSVSVNPSRYQAPAASELTVTLTRESDGKTWTFSGREQYTAASSGLYFNLDSSNRGVNNCIIFRPDGISQYEGVYTVQIDGLRANGGSSDSLSYQVDFFRSKDYKEEQPTQQPEQPAKKLAKAADQNIEIDGRPVAFQTYVLHGTNYVKLRDIAHVLNGTAAQFSVGYDNKAKSISAATGAAYQDTGTEMDTPFAGMDKDYARKDLTIVVNGVPVKLDALSMKDDKGNGYNYFKLRDLGSALGFKVDYTKERGVYLETE